MPRSPRRVTRALLQRAALLRAQGSPWAAVAKLVGVTARAARGWPLAHARLWRGATRLAEEHLLGEATSESVLTLRRQLRSEDDKTSREAAQKLIAFRIATTRRKPARRAVGAARPATLGSRVATYLETLTDADLAAIVTRPEDLELPPAPRGRAADVAGAAGGG